MKNNKRIVFVNRFFYPDISATAQILGELVFDLAEKGSRITVLTSRSAYDNTDIIFPKAQQINGVEVIRVGKNHFSRTNYLGRLIDLICFYIVLSARLLKIINTSDVLVCKTDPPFLLVIGGLVKRFKKCRLISWNQDLFPEVAAIYFSRYPLKLIYPGLKLIRDLSLKLCDQCVVISDSMQSRFKALGIDRVHIITNWGKQICADPDKVSALKKNWQIEGKFIVEYSGNFGFVHEYETIKNTVELLQFNANIVFLFIGSGKHYESLQKHVQTKKLGNVIFKPYQSASKLSESLSLADLHLITFRPQMEGLVFPSKFYSICAAARPVLFIGDPQAELARIIRTSNCGRSFDVGQTQQVVDYIIESTNSTEQLARQGDNALELFQRNYTLKQAQAKWTRVLELTGSD